MALNCLQTCLLLILCFIGASGLLLGPQRLFSHFRPPHQKPRKVLLVSFDGFRLDYVDRYDTPYLDTFARVGVRAGHGMKPTFLANTFPNHYTLVTGLYEESHGIIDNYFYDPVLNETFSSSNPSYDPRWWNGGEPIWVTARKNGKKSGTIFWIGSEAEIRGVRPNLYLPYNNSMTIRERLQTAFNWLETGQVDLACVYFNQPDVSGHQFGAFSNAVASNVTAIDKEVGFILKRLIGKKLVNLIDVIIVSDHGMMNLTSKNPLILLSDYIDIEKDVKMIPQYGAMAGIIPADGKLEYVYQKLKNAHPHLKVFLKDQIPEEFHYKRNVRITPLVALADPGYAVLPSKDFDDGNMGYHGYDPAVPAMRPIFYATGPSFRKGYVKQDVFENVNVYPLLCHVLGIEPAPNNGSLKIVQDLFRVRKPIKRGPYPLVFQGR